MAIDKTSLVQKALVRLPFADQTTTETLADEFLNEPSEKIALYKLVIELIKIEISAIQSASIGDLKVEGNSRLEALKTLLADYKEKLKKETGSTVKIVPLPEEEPKWD
ncbi:MAG TPA: hypothetical protein DEP48_02895 [Persephonella sp.]|uniref:Uncharacterized protein n=1 Tax=Persephonella marina (strain DSM 14350 / EX-H1) TaxID=123214 RepID=C0QS96_PERMH|nr:MULTISPECIES: hypothetical protein [Persephonella]ACO03390.1 hypothetical protein PERMA_1779 [Persephonella marina EX-H1]HCB69285.1 hypothetical protein [Persephonella sp.]